MNDYFGSNVRRLKSLFQQTFSGLCSSLAGDGLCIVEEDRVRDIEGDCKRAGTEWVDTVETEENTPQVIARTEGCEFLELTERGKIPFHPL